MSIQLDFEGNGWNKTKNLDDVNVEELKEYLLGIFNTHRSKERKVHAYRGCSTYGWVYYGTDFTKEQKMCQDPECSSCRYWEKCLLEESSSYLTLDPEFLKDEDNARNRVAYKQEATPTSMEPDSKDLKEEGL